MEYIIKPAYENAPIRFFQDLTRIPRGSGNEKEVTDYLMDFAKEHGLEATRDENLNVIIKKDGQGKGKGKPGVILQGHTDMVCEKNSDTDFDFLTQPLDIYVDGDWLKARGTTLGADDGVAVAYMLACLSDTESDFPPLECIFTAEEETGLSGANGLSMAEIEGNQMINLDHGLEGTFVVSCAGGADIVVTKSGERTNIDGSALKIDVKGLAGGHSGADIDKELGNANKILGRIIEEVMANTKTSVSSINGGDKRNAIPRESNAAIIVEDKDKAKKAIDKISAEIKEELAITDSGLEIIVSDSAEKEGFSYDDSKAIIDILFSLPAGPFHRYIHMDNVVVNSVNIAVLKTKGDIFEVGISVRSSIASLKEELLRQIEKISKAFGATTERNTSYSGWGYAENSPLRDTAMKVYKEVTGKEAEMEAMHAGLECGILLEKKPTLDIISMGPSMSYIHTPNERLSISSFESTYKYLAALLTELAK